MLVSLTVVYQEGATVQKAVEIGLPIPSIDRIVSSPLAKYETEMTDTVCKITSF